MLTEEAKEIQKRLDFIEFRQQLLFDNDNLSRLLFEYQINQLQYKEIMDLMEKYRILIDKKKSVNHGTFEQEIYEIVPNRLGDYHFCEFICKAFMDEHRWEEVFFALYGDMPKYSYIRNNEND